MGYLSTSEDVLPWRHVALLLVGFPILYMRNSVTPWAHRLWGENDHACYLPFFGSLLALHWLSVAVAIRLAHRSGLVLTDMGLHTTPAQGCVLVVSLVAGGAVLIWLREMSGPHDPLWAVSPAGLHLAGTGERGVWIAVSLSAGFCEEFVHRGFAITVLQRRGVHRWQAVALGTASWVFIHGVGGLTMFPVVFVVGLVFAAIFLWRRSLAPAMVVHALLDLTLLGS